MIIQWYLRIRMLLLLRVLPSAWWTQNIWRGCWLLLHIDGRCGRGRSRGTASPSALSIFGRGGLVQFSLQVDPASIERLWYTHRESKPSHYLTVLSESAETIQEVGRKGQKGKGSEHLPVGLVGNIVEFEIYHFSQIWEEVGSEHEAND